MSHTVSTSCPDELLSILTRMSRKVEDRYHGANVEGLAHFLLFSTMCSPSLSGEEISTNQSSSFFNSSSMLIRSQGGMLPVAVCADDREKVLLTRLSSHMTRFAVSCGQHIQPMVITESLGEVGSHMAFRHPCIAQQYMTQLLTRVHDSAAQRMEDTRMKRPQRVHGADSDTKGPPPAVCVAAVVLHVHVSHIPDRLASSVLLPFLHVMDAASVAHRATLGGDGEVIILPSVLVSTATPLDASVVHESLQRALRSASCPSVIAAVFQSSQRRGNTGRATELPPWRWTRRDIPFFWHHINVPLASFIADVVSLFGCMLDEHALMAVKASWCARHDMRDVVLCLHGLLCSFHYTRKWLPLISVGGEISSRSRSREPSLLEGGEDGGDEADRHERLRTTAMKCIDAVLRIACGTRSSNRDVSVSVRWAACMLEAIAQGDSGALYMLSQPADVRKGGDDGEDSDDSDEYATQNGVMDLVCRRQIACAWVRNCTIRQAAALVNLQDPEVVAPSRKVIASGGSGEAPRKKLRAETSPRMLLSGSTLVAAPCVSLKSILLETLCTRIEHIEQSLQGLTTSLSLPENSGSPTAHQAGIEHPPDASTIPFQVRSLNFFHACVPFSLRVLAVLTHMGGLSKTVKGTWISLHQVCLLSCHNEPLLLVSCLRQLRAAGLIAVNGATHEARSLLL